MMKAMAFQDPPSVGRLKPDVNRGRLACQTNYAASYDKLRHAIGAASVLFLTSCRETALVQSGVLTPARI